MLHVGVWGASATDQPCKTPCPLILSFFFGSVIDPFLFGFLSKGAGRGSNNSRIICPPRALSSVLLGVDALHPIKSIFFCWNHWSSLFFWSTNHWYSYPTNYSRRLGSLGLVRSVNWWHIGPSSLILGPSSLILYHNDVISIFSTKKNISFNWTKKNVI